MIHKIAGSGPNRKDMQDNRRRATGVRGSVGGLNDGETYRRQCEQENPLGRPPPPHPAALRLLHSLNCHAAVGSEQNPPPGRDRGPRTNRPACRTRDINTVSAKQVPATTDPMSGNGVHFSARLNILPPQRRAHRHPPNPVPHPFAYPPVTTSSMPTWASWRSL